MNQGRIIGALVPVVGFSVYWAFSGDPEMALGAFYGLIMGALAFYRNCG